MDFNKYSKEQLGEAYKQIVGYNPFEDDADISKEEVVELIKGYDQAIAEEGSFGGTTFEQYFSSIKDENPVGKKAAIVAEKIIKKESDSSAVKKYKDDLLKKSSLIFDIISETIGTFTLKHGKTEIRVPRDLVLVLNDQPGNVSNGSLTKEIREKASKILLPHKVGVKVSDLGNTITIEPVDYSRSAYKSKLDGMQVIYDISKKEYEVSEFMAGPNQDELHIYKETPSLTVAIKEMLKGNGRKPIKIWDNDQSHKGAKIKGRDFENGGEISDIKYYIKITPSDKRWPSHVWKEGGLFDTPEVAEQHASRIRKMKDEYDVRKKKYSKVEVLPINKKEIGNLFAAIDDVTAVNLYMSEKAGVGRNGNRLSEDELAERIINDYKSNRISASTLWRVLNDGSLISGKKASYVYDQLGFIPFQGYPLIKKSNKEYVYDKGGLTPDSILDSSGEPSITAIQQQYYHRVSKALKSIAPNLELWKNFSIRDKDTNLVYRVDSFLFKRVGGKLQEIVFNYVHGQSSASIGELSIVFSSEEININFESLGVSKTEKFAWGGMAANVIGEKRARDIAKYFCKTAEKAGKEQEVVSLCKFAKDGFSVDLVLPCKEELNNITFRVALEDILRLRYYFDQFIPSKEQAELMKKNPDKFSEGGISKENAASLALMVKAQRIVDYTNRRLENWYKTIKEDYNVEGHGKAKFDKSRNAIVINFTENGNNYTHEELYWQDEPIDYTFNVWMDSTDFAKGGNVLNANDNPRGLWKVVGKKNGQFVDITELPMSRQSCFTWIKDQGIEKHYTNVGVVPYRGPLKEFKYNKGGLADIFDKTIGQALYFLETEKDFSVREVKSRTRQDRKYDVFDIDSKFVKTLSRNEVVDFAKEQGFKFAKGGEIKKTILDSVKVGDVISFYTSCNADRKKMVGLVEYKDQLGFITIVDGVQYELRKLVDVKLEHGDNAKEFLEDGVCRNLPKNYPNIYFHDRYDHKYPSITFIRFSVTPSGKIGKDFEQYRIYVKPGSKFENMTLSELCNYAKQNMKLHNLKKGYEWGELFIQHNFLRRDESFEHGGSVSVQPGDRVAFKDTGSIVRIDRESGDLMVRDASGNTQSIPKSRILEKFKYGGISRK